MCVLNWGGGQELTVWQTNGLTCTQSLTDHSHNCPHTHPLTHYFHPEISTHGTRLETHQSWGSQGYKGIHSPWTQPWFPSSIPESLSCSLSSTKTSINHVDFKPLSDGGKTWHRNLPHYTTPLNLVPLSLFKLVTIQWQPFSLWFTASLKKFLPQM